MRYVNRLFNVSGICFYACALYPYATLCIVSLAQSAQRVEFPDVFIKKEHGPVSEELQINNSISTYSPPQTREDIAKWLAIPEKSLRYFLYVKRVENLYYDFKIAKKSGGYREIHAPCNELKSIQRKLSDALSRIYEPKSCVYGFVNGKNIIGNARKHVRNRCILNIDLKDFFHQIHIGRIIGLLTSKPYSFGREAATVIAQIACYYKSDSKYSFLPQGAPSSPIISNMVASSLDTKLIRFAEKHKLFYTRYADDITISTARVEFDPKVLTIRNGEIVLSGELTAIFSKSNFEINEEKLKIKNQAERQEVTGLVVNKKVNIKREYIKKIRAILHNCEKDGIYNTALTYIRKQGYINPNLLDKHSDHEYIENYFFLVIKGKLEFVRQVRGKTDEVFIKYARQANALFNSQGFKLMFDLSYVDQLDKVIKQNVFILHNNPNLDKVVQATGFFVKEYGFFTSYHVIEHGEMMFIYHPDNFPKQNRRCFLDPDRRRHVDYKIDYAIFDIVPPDVLDSLSLGDSESLEIGDEVIIAGFPNYSAGGTINIQSCNLVERKFFMGGPFWKVSGRVMHGMSGGIVLNDKYEVVGILKGGIVSMKEDLENDNQGFVPMHCIVEDIESKKLIQ